MSATSPNIERVKLHETARQRYLHYAISVITSRALPDVRDGLKPVQRRILYSMHEMRLSPQTPYRKSAQVVGNTMGKLHPHGDSAIYEAMVRLAQPFSLRYTLVDGHGNFGSLDGDSAAAMRYTEARLTPIAVELLNDLDDRIVDFKPTYDGSMQEPSVLPAAAPNLLINGATGIAVGMATHIPPHNLSEVISAALALIDNPKLSSSDLLKWIPGPDFPTGGRLLNDPASLREIYESGHGTLDVHGEYVLEGDGKNKQIIITSIPYMVNKALLIEKIADHIASNKLPLLTDIRDESTTDVRIVLDLKTGANPEAAMAYLYKHTPLRARFHVNMTCLVPDPTTGVGKPHRLSLLETLQHFLSFRLEVTTNRLRLLASTLHRKLHILSALAKVASNPQQIINLLRDAPDRAAASDALKKLLDLDDDQAKAILDMPLYRLVRVEVDDLTTQLASLRAEYDATQALLNSEPKRWDMIKSDLKDIRKRYSDPRRTTLGSLPPALTQEFNEDNYIVDEDVVVVISRQGWIKRQRSFSDIASIRTRENDSIGWVFKASTRRCLILFSDLGQAYTLRVDALSQTSGYGDPVQSKFNFADGERIIGAITSDPRSLPNPNPQEADDDLGPWLLSITRAGMATRMALAPFCSPSTISGRRFMKLQDDFPNDRICSVEVAWGPEAISLASKNARIMNVLISDIPLNKNPAKGARVINLDHTDEVFAFTLASHEHEGLCVTTTKGLTKTISLRDFPPVYRGSPGRWLTKKDTVASVRLSPTLRGLQPEDN
jgi:DNA gyrase subunit A